MTLFTTDKTCKSSKFANKQKKLLHVSRLVSFGITGEPFVSMEDYVTLLLYRVFAELICNSASVSRKQPVGAAKSVCT